MRGAAGRTGSSTVWTDSPPGQEVVKVTVANPVPFPTVQGRAKDVPCPPAGIVAAYEGASKDRRASALGATVTATSRDPLEKSTTGITNLSPGATARGSVASATTSRAIRAFSATAPLRDPAAPTAMIRTLPLNSGTSKDTVARPSASVDSRGLTRARGLNRRPRTGDRDPLSMASASPPPPGCSRGVMLFSAGRRSS